MSAGLALQLALDSLAAAGVYALVALGIQTAFAGSGVLHLAAGDSAIAGVLTGAVAMEHGLTAPLAVLLGLAIAALTGAALETSLVRPVRGRPVLAATLLVLGGTVVRELGGALFSGRYTLPSIDTTWSIGGGVLHASDLLSIGVALALGGGVAVVLQRTAAGAALRITAATPMAAELCGVDTARVRRIAFALAGALAAAAVVLAAGRIPPSTASAVPLTLKGAAAAIAGGLGSPAGAGAGALLVGTTEVMGSYWFGGGGGEALVFGVAAAALALRGRR